MLLTGERPYDVRGKSPAEIERIVCTEVPPRPSSQLPPAVAGIWSRPRSRPSIPCSISTGRDVGLDGEWWDRRHRELERATGCRECARGVGRAVCRARSLGGIVERAFSENSVRVRRHLLPHDAERQQRDQGGYRVQVPEVRALVC